ncbi:MAG: hypothetical protein RLZZ428_773 [Pseudomonadota bacterium]|jgi:uncharacterized membrane protein YhiD involved in acid resistance
MDMVEITPASVGILLVIILVMVIRENFKLGKENSQLRDKRTHHTTQKKDQEHTQDQEIQKEIEESTQEVSHYDQAKEMLHKGIAPDIISEKLGIPLTEINLMVKFEKIKQRG